MFVTVHFPCHSKVLIGGITGKYCPITFTFPVALQKEHHTESIVFPRLRTELTTYNNVILSHFVKGVFKKRLADMHNIFDGVICG